MKFVYLNIIKEIKRNNETQRSIAKLLGIGETTIRYKLAGEYDWTISEIETLCDYFKKDYYELFKRED